MEEEWSLSFLTQFLHDHKAGMLSLSIKKNMKVQFLKTKLKLYDFAEAKAVWKKEHLCFPTNEKDNNITYTGWNAMAFTG